jgi:hypothetical protein
VESHSRRRLRGIAAIILAVGFAVTGVQAPTGPQGVRGIYALSEGAPKIVSLAWSKAYSNRSRLLTIRQYPSGGTMPILRYDVELQRLMHLIVVRDDFATFEHFHPSFDPKSGEFEEQIYKGPNHRYYAFTDTTPHGIGQQVFRFTIERDSSLSTHSPVNAVTPSLPSVASIDIAPYRVSLARTTLTADLPQSVDLTVLKNGERANDLKPYLGAAAHAVFINTSTLAYVHVHPTVRGVAPMATGSHMEMNGGAGPLMQMSLPALPDATYKLWIQFRGAGDKIITAPFTILVR